MLPFFYHSYSKPCSAEFHTFSLQVISSSNLTLYPKKLQLVDAVTGNFFHKTFCSLLLVWKNTLSQSSSLAEKC